MKKRFIIIPLIFVLGVAAYFLFFQTSTTNFKLDVVNGGTPFTVTLTDSGGSVTNFTGVTSLILNLSQNTNYSMLVSSPGFVSKTFDFTGQSEQTIILIPLSQSSKPIDYLLIYNPVVLSSKYNSTSDITQSIQKLRDSLEISGFNPKILTVNSSSSPEIRKQVKNLISTYNPQYVLLIGGDDSIPFFQVKNPLVDDSGAPVIPEDTFVESDNPYSFNDDFLKPQSPAIGRIIDSFDGLGEEEFIQQLLSLSTNNGVENGTIKMISKDTEPMYLSFSGLNLLSPIFTIGEQQHDLVKVNELFNLLQNPYAVGLVTLHGNVGSEPQFLLGKNGIDDPGLLVIDSLLDFNFSLSGKVFLADSCYGANPRRPVKGSLPVNLLISGGKAFVGSTETSYSSTKPTKDSTESDFLDAGVTNSIIYFTKKYYEQGIPIGKALNLAKQKLDISLSINRLTSLEYIILGRPDWTISGFNK
ncbi:Uncharacterised protein [uncultured archaeon]|nr:Uncharacterised protein [uncultured archaeon]